MNSEHDKYFEMLSAYVDDELPPDKVREVEAFIASNAEAAAIVERLRKLASFSEENLPDIDDRVLDELESRITAEIEELPDTTAGKPPSKARITPIWQKYAAIAASVLIMVLAGKIALDYRENIIGPETPKVKESTPPTQLKKPQQQKTAQEKDQGKASDEFRQLPAEQKRAVGHVREESEGSAKSEEAIRTPVPVTMKKATQAAEPKAAAETGNLDDALLNEMEARGQTSAEEDYDLAVAPERRATIVGVVRDKKTGEAIPGATVQVEGTSRGARTDSEGGYAIFIDSLDTFSLQVRGVGYEPLELSDITIDEVKRDSINIGMLSQVVETGQVVTVTGKRKGIDFNSTGTANKKTEITVPPNILTDALDDTIASVEELNTQFAALLQPAKSSSSVPGITAFNDENKIAAPKLKPSETSVLDSILLTPLPENNFPRIENLYMKIRASYYQYERTRNQAIKDSAENLTEQLIQTVDDVFRHYDTGEEKRQIEAITGGKKVIEYKYAVEALREKYNRK